MKMASEGKTKYAALLFAALCLSGCVSHEGISLWPADPSENLIVRHLEDERKSRRNAMIIAERKAERLAARGGGVSSEANGQQAASAQDAIPVPSLIAVGPVSSLRRFNERNIDKSYERYVATVARIRPDSVAELSRSEYEQRLAGWTNLKLFTVPLVLGHYQSVLVPFALVDNIKFPPVAGVMLGQETGDLLAARTNPDGLFVVEAVLCRDGITYYHCAKVYEKGYFDAVTGFEIDSDLQPNRSGTQIDPVTFRRVTE